MTKVLEQATSNLEILIRIISELSKNDSLTIELIELIQIEIRKIKEVFIILYQAEVEAELQQYEN